MSYDQTPAQVQPGVYALQRNLRFMLEAHEPLVGFLNYGKRDCTVDVLSRDDIVPVCPCMVHEERKGAHAAGQLIASQMAYAGRVTPLSHFAITGYPLIIAVRDFVAGTPPPPMPEPPRVIIPESDPYTPAQGVPDRHLTHPSAVSIPQPVVLGDGVQTPPLADYLQVTSTVAPPAPPAPRTPMATAQSPQRSVPQAAEEAREYAKLFPGFVVRCELCGSLDISLESRPGRSGAIKHYLECESCGVVGRVLLS